MRRQYASSVYSQKSTTSAKSGRSFLSLTTLIWPTATTTNNNNSTATPNEITLNEAKQQQGVWQSLKSWIPATTTTKKTNKKNDTDSITTTRSSSSSISKLKQLFVVNKKKMSSPLSVNESPRLSFDVLDEEEEEEEEDTSSSTTASDNKKTRGPIGILINRGEDSAEAIAERKRRRHQRRENILKLQKHNRSLQHHHFNKVMTTNTVITVEPLESSSSDTLLTDDPDYHPTTTTTTKMVAFSTGGTEEDEDNDCWGYNPRIMFVEPSPVPRFRNVAPPPPPSPPYLNILIHDQQEVNNNMHSIIKSPTTEQDEPTIFASRDSFIQSDQPTTLMKQPLFDEQEDEDRQMSLLLDSLKSQPIQKPRLYFNSPLYRGQTLKFSLQNTIPDDHIILFKFLTSNTQQQQPERYFVRPSAGKMVSTDQTDIMLFLNQVPREPVKKDKIIIRWAVIQKNTRIEQWVNSLQDSSRRKWIDMLDEEWPDQVTIRMTRIKIRFI